MKNVFQRGDLVSVEGKTLSYEIEEKNLSEDGEFFYNLKDLLGASFLLGINEKFISFKDINKAVKLRGIDFDSHESDLYIPKNEITEKIIEHYNFKNNVTEFISQIDNCTWYDIPFAFNDFWEKKKV